MFRKLIQFSLRESALVLIVSALALAFAIYQVPRMPVDVFPDLNAPTVVILTETGGLAADEVEQYVTFPVETAVNGVPGVRRVRSASAISLSIVWVEFDWGTDIYRARQLVSERLDAVREVLPEDAHAEITPVTSITGEIMLLSLSSPDKSASDLELRAYAEFDLRNRLLAVPGIAQVVAIGGDLPEYQVLVKQDRLLLYGLNIEDVVNATREAHSIASAGYLANVDRQEVPLRQAAQVRSINDIKATVIRFEEGVPITIGQVAVVQLGPALKRGTASESGQSAVVLTIQKQPGTNTLLLTENIDLALDQIIPTLPTGMVLNRHVFRQADFINLSVDNVIRVLKEASVFVAIVLVLFLMNLRTTLITLTALPLSLAAGLLAMWLLDMSINVMTLGGLAVAIGVLVDDAIIDVENVHRRLGQNAQLPPDRQEQRVTVIFNACNEIRSSMVFATIIIVIVFVPLLFLHGIEGRFFRPLGITYIVSILASMIVALTAIPALCKFLLGTVKTSHDRDSFFARWLKRVYEPALRFSLKWRKVVLGGATIITAMSIWLATTFGTSFLPEFNEGTLTLFVSTPPGTSLEESDRLAGSIEARIATLDGVRSVVRRTGRAERDEHAEPVSNSELDVSLLPGYEKLDVHKQIDDVLKNVPGVTTMIGQPIEHRLSHILSGTPAAIAIKVFGDDLDVLRSLAKEIEAAIRSIPGARDVNANREVMISSLPIRYRHADLAAVGLTPTMAAHQVQHAMYGEVVAEVNEGVRRIDLVVRLDPEDRQTIEDVRNLLLQGKGGALVRLSEVADIGPERTSNLIARENAQRKAVISANVAEHYNLGHLVEQVKERVDPIVARAGYTVVYGGQFEAQQSASRTILIMGSGVMIVILLLLHMSLGSIKASLLVMVNLPLALIGGIMAIFLTESGNPVTNALALFGLWSHPFEAPVISIASMVGFITLFGIAVRNGILLVNHYKYLMEVEMRPFDEALVRGSMERLIPILMTALAAALGLIPLALAAGRPGSELLSPLAIVVLGGLISSTFLNLVVVPTGYYVLFRRDSLTESHDKISTETL